MFAPSSVNNKLAIVLQVFAVDDPKRDEMLHEGVDIKGLHSLDPTALFQAHLSSLGDVLGSLLHGGLTFQLLHGVEKFSGGAIAEIIIGSVDGEGRGDWGKVGQGITCAKMHKFSLLLLIHLNLDYYLVNRVTITSPNKKLLVHGCTI